MRRIHVVDDVDPADEGNFAVDVAKLAVQPSQAVRPELPGRDFRAVFHQLDAGVEHVALECSAQIQLGAPTVDQHANPHATLCRTSKRRCDQATGGVVCEDVAFEPNLMLCGLERLHQGGKIFGAIAQQCHPVAWSEAVHRRSTGSFSA